MKTYVIMCTHNGGLFLKDQLDSLLYQKGTIHKICIFDFASSDATRSIIESYSDSRITAEYFEHIPGPKKSFLHAIDMIANIVSDDDLIFFCDQDDRWYPSKVQVMQQFMRKHELDVGWHNFDLIDAKSILIPKKFYSGVYGLFPTRKSQLPKYWNLVVGNTMCVSGVYLRKFVSTVSGNAGMVRCYGRMHDECLILFGIFENFRCAGLDRKLSTYRIHDNNLIGEPKIKITKLYNKIKLDFIFAQNIDDILNNFTPRRKNWNNLMQIYYCYFKILTFIGRYFK